MELDEYGRIDVDPKHLGNIRMSELDMTQVICIENCSC